MKKTETENEGHNHTYIRVNPRNTRQKKCPDPDFGWPNPDTFRVYDFKKFQSQSEAREWVPRWLDSSRTWQSLRENWFRHLKQPWGRESNY